MLDSGGSAPAAWPRCHFFAGADFVPALLDLAGAVLGRDLDGLRVAHEAAGQRGNAFGVGGREQQGLAIRRALAHHGFDVAEKAHVQHAIGLVQHQGLEVADVELAALHQIHHAPGCADDDVRAVFQRGDLVARGHAAIDGDDLDVVLRARQAADLGGDLVGQLARGAQHQGLDGKPARVQAVDHGQAEGSRLAAAGAGLGDQVLALQGQRQAGGLDGRHLRIAELLEVGQHFGDRGSAEKAVESEAWAALVEVFMGADYPGPAQEKPCAIAIHGAICGLPSSIRAGHAPSLKARSSMAASV
jgi:hypothetical protein